MDTQSSPGGDPFAVVLGAGPGVGAAFARQLGRRGYRVALVARDAGRLSALAEQVRAGGIDVRTATADAADGDGLAAVVDELAKGAGRLDVLHYNPSRFRAGGVRDVTPQDLLDDLALGAVGLLAAVRGGLEHLLVRGGTVVATGGGAADRAMPGGLTLPVEKGALRSLVIALAAELLPQGIHVATVTVRGTIKPGTPFAPDVVAAALAGLVEETAGPRESWRTVVDLTRDGLR
ncbi:MAG TPA: SDR family NAD(P)-dependent oxidoreductase [Kineosporiaceae bacterium]|nr:SDR family NAD(P)-dependent oxidoreductase [Kineosporiaceae bacterium]